MSTNEGALHWHYPKIDRFCRTMLVKEKWIRPH